MSIISLCSPSLGAIQVMKQILPMQLDKFETPVLEGQSLVISKHG